MNATVGGAPVTIASVGVGDDEWPIRLVINLLGYATVIIPGALLIKYFSRRHRLTSKPPGIGLLPIDWLLRLCVLGTAERSGEPAAPLLPTSLASSGQQQQQQNQRNSPAMRLIFCSTGLLCSYLVWGVLQEKVMTRNYINSRGDTARFTDSQFLVFVNRVFAFVISGVYLLSRQLPRHSATATVTVTATTTPPHSAPLYKYAYSSFSNIMSSWCQYEALKFVSFPTQVLAKASKVIPVMVMGKIVSGNKYQLYEYITAVLISVGMSLFLLATSNSSRYESVTTLSGVMLLAGYMVFDAFTSNWQNALYKQYSMSSMQMMCGVNLFSCLLTSVSLLQQAAFFNGVKFMLQYPSFMFDCLLLSTFSASGQLFIFYTIAQFGAVIFTIIMTVRQGLAILISCVLYSHPISSTGIVGVLIVFAAIFLRIYCSVRTRSIRQQSAMKQKSVSNTESLNA